ncbi:cobalt ABC transporter permease [Citrobacter sp.]|uniref:cobalt ABC transporter permease n=1 Tax=Citrobacter sp. TaxID=1896336 RepID=UPI003FA5FE39
MVDTKQDLPVTQFELEYFEFLAVRGDVELAASQLLFLLEQLDNHYGLWGEKVTARAAIPAPHQIERLICTRIAGAVTTLFCRQDFSVSDGGFRRLMALHRWLALIFAVSSFGNGDHIIRTLNAAGGGVSDPLSLNEGNIRQFCLSYYPDSCIPLQTDALWQFDRATVVQLFFVLLSGRALPGALGHGKKEQLLAWLPEHMDDIETLDAVPVPVLHDVYMHCSYADLPSRHAIKGHINRLVRQAMENAPLAQHFPFPAAPVRERKRLVVVLEWFSSQHSIYRTHSSTMRALRAKFHVTGMAQVGATDEITRDVFDEFIEVPSASAVYDMVAHLREILPDIVYYPSVGMFPLTVYMVNLRMAPLQLMALGHPATTGGSCIDGVMVEEDYLGDPSCFVENVHALPKDALPYLPPANTQRILQPYISFEDRRKAAYPQELPVRVAVCASVMKINPGFLNALAEITRRAQVPLQFCFYLGFAQGLTLHYLRDTILSVLPGAEVNAHMPVQAYQVALNSCEMFISPFPFGNTNGLVDTVRQGLPGVCLSGSEVFSHIDEGLFHRLGLPDDLITRDTEQYIRAVVRLAEDTDWRESLQKQLRDNDPEQVLFTGRPEQFALKVTELSDAVYAKKTTMRG